MKVYNENRLTVLEPSLQLQLEAYRNGVRKFDVKSYIDAKVTVINNYMRKSGLKGCVVGISGGVDSAVVLALLDKAKKCEGSPIERIVPLMLPALPSSNGLNKVDNYCVTNQESATSKGRKLANHFGYGEYVFDLSRISEEVSLLLSSSLGIEADNWANGQLVPYMRTPVCYFATSLLTKAGIPSLVCGTINRDEGAYLGYVGKASDGMVDVQVISDLHESEVYAVARELGVIDEVLNAIPSGDMYDGRVDEEVFGASYDFVELYLHYLTLIGPEKTLFERTLSVNGNKDFKQLQENLEKLHGYNGHKYAVGSPAFHLDVLDSDVPGGWSFDYKSRVAEKYLIGSNVLKVVEDIIFDINDRRGLKHCWRGLEVAEQSAVKLDLALAITSSFKCANSTPLVVASIANVFSNIPVLHTELSSLDSNILTEVQNTWAEVIKEHLI